jgi:hypothetical protein
VLIFGIRVKYVVSLIGKLAKGRHEMTDERFYQREKKVLREEPPYVRTVEEDGRKGVDPNKFIEDTRVQRQIRRLARQAASR